MPHARRGGRQGACPFVFVKTDSFYTQTKKKQGRFSSQKRKAAAAGRRAWGRFPEDSRRGPTAFLHESHIEAGSKAE
jgi:hypothetical protein